MLSQLSYERIVCKNASHLLFFKLHSHTNCSNLANSGGPLQISPQTGLGYGAYWTALIYRLFQSYNVDHSVACTPLFSGARFIAQYFCLDLCLTAGNFIFIFMGFWLTIKQIPGSCIYYQPTSGGSRFCVWGG